MLPLEASIQDVILSLEASGLQIVLVVDDGGRLRGAVTDGDVRRALLRGKTLQSRVDDIMYPNPLVVPPDLGRDMVLQLMRANRIHQVPVVDAEHCVIGLYVLDDIITPPARDNLMVIMAGGFGTRLHPFTQDCPKPMLPIAGKPMLEHIIERARAEGFSRFLLSIHYLGHMIEEYFGNGAHLNVSIEYLREDAPLGTAGAIGLIDPLPPLPFVVTNGDVLTDISYADMLDFHQRHGAEATMAVRQHEWQHPFGVVRTQGIEIVGFEEKPVHRTHVNAGVYVLEPTSLAFLRKGERCDMPTLFERLQGESLSTIAYPMHEPWLDVGRPDDLEHARRTIKN